ncbi:CapA family protein [Pilimelia columellifera]|uniref:Capsule synthesis protein CapA domain-containing protein n=1 Tax=Pilimelia columellifera subsp. columellifera TaxID=706583 RepID=A0ABN3NC74_9ACTN
MAGVIATVVIGGAAIGVGALASTGAPADAPRWLAPLADAPGQTPPSPRSDGEAVSLAAVGDIVLGSAPHRLPANDGVGLFDGVSERIEADLVMGNLEGVLTDDTGVSKCRRVADPSASPRIASPTPNERPQGGDCFQFRAPPRYARHLKAAGFDLLNLANNHANDFGSTGLRNTHRALEGVGLDHTGGPDEIAVVERNGIAIAVVGFSSYAWSNSLLRLDEAREVVRRARDRAEIVVVQAHMGAEGINETRVTPGEERFLGENRGDPVGFSRAMVDAGADLVIGHGPHVLRGMEFYRGRLIAYSLGNFAAGGGVLSERGRLGLGGLLTVTLNRDGAYRSGRFLSTVMRYGRPTVDPDGAGLALVRRLSSDDFPQSDPDFDGTGRIAPSS